MSKRPTTPAIRLRGVRHNNLKNFDLDLPLHNLIVVTGPSGSGKSSLAFDTLFAEGQRRYIETFSPYARQFFDRMDKPQVDRIEGIPPAIAIEQRNTVKTTRSTVGTMTEICEHMKALWTHIAQLHCRQCGQVVRKDSPQSIWETLRNPDHSFRPSASGVSASVWSDMLITFALPLSEKLSLEETLALTSKQGYQRLLLDGHVVRLEEALERLSNSRPASLTIIQDRVQVSSANRVRFVEACEQAYHFGKGKLGAYRLGPSFSPGQRVAETPSFFSNRFHCARCDLEYREPTPSLFSFNNPVGACPSCRGFGRIITIDHNLAIPDASKTLAGGVVKPWQTGHGAECQEDLLKYCKIRGVPTDVPFEKLTKQWQDWVIQGEPDYGKDPMHEWPHAWYGIKGYFRWLESKAYKMHVRVLLSRYRSYQLCPDCQGKRFQPDALLFKVRDERRSPPLSSENRPALLGRIDRPRGQETVKFAPDRRTGQQESSQIGDVDVLHDRVIPTSLENLGMRPSNCVPDLTLADFYQLPIRDALEFIKRLSEHRRTPPSDPVRLVLNELESRLNYLVEVGLGYLTLDRPTRSLSGGETERVNLTACLGTCLVNSLFVLDEPSVGLHPRDTDRLIQTLKRLRDAGNTVVVVEHESSVIRAADQIVDLGPGQGERGGQVIFQGTISGLCKCPESLTGQYLSGKKQVEIPRRRPIFIRGFGNTRMEKDPVSKLVLTNAKLYNLKDLTVQIPLQRFICITGVSGSGKTTLIREVLLPLLQSQFKVQNQRPLDADAVEALGSGPLGNQPSDLNPQLLTGWENLGRVVLVDQSALGKTPRSNPAVYIGAFDDLRDLFAGTEEARQRGLKASSFSFNSREGQCERCRGAGFEKIEMQFLSDVYIRCPDCNGRRYRPHILEVKLSPKSEAEVPRAKGRFRQSAARATRQAPRSAPAWSIADLLEATVDEVIQFLDALPDTRPVQRARQSLKLLQEVGLGYLRLGQPINTLSGGESQRLKLVSYLAEFTEANSTEFKPTLFLFDEPTTGLHFDDVRILLQVFQRLVDAGHSVVVIEHNLDVIKSADWIIDLGPEAGDLGGEIVAEGTPEQVAACAASHTGRALKESRVL